MTHGRRISSLPIVARANAFRRAMEVERRYRNLVRHYGQHTPVPSEVLWSRGDFHHLRLSSPPRVLYCGTDPLQDYGGFLQALGSKCDLRVLTQEDGKYGQAVDGVAWDVNSEALSRTLTNLAGEGWKPEVLMMQSMGMRLHPADLVELKRVHGFIVINIGMDERLAYKLRTFEGVELGISGLNSAVDLALVTAPEVVRWYEVDGVPVKYFPLASALNVYHPDESARKLHDVGFIGRAYGRRLVIANKIARAGVSFKGLGPGWPDGGLAVEDNNRFYNSCRVVLGTGNIGHSKRLMNPKLRDIEVPLTGVPYVTNYTPELADLYKEDEEIVLYRSESELLEKISWLIANPEIALRIGMAGHRRASSEHTYASRFDILFDRVLAGDFNASFVAVDSGRP